MWFIVTVKLHCGDKIVLETKCLEETLLEVESYYGDSLASYDARRR